MIAIRLEWQRPADGVEIVTDEITGLRQVRARSKEMEGVPYSITSLEDPIGIRLINCHGDDDIVAFLNRFGIPINYGKHDTIGSIPDRIFTTALDELAHTLMDIYYLNSVPSSPDKVRFATQELRQAVLRPAFEFVEGKQALIMRPDHLSDLMLVEAAFAFDAGATLVRCAHCSKAYLTGPLTGRRSHAVYCSDRCRVAAMRKRNAEKSGSGAAPSNQL